MTRYLKLGFLSILSLAGLYIAFKGEDLDQLVSHLANVDLIFVTIACVLLLFSCIIRAYRWKLLLYPFDKVQLKSVYSATMIGYFGNAILAFRLGELLKAYSVIKGTRIKTLQAFGTVIIERLLDVIALVIIFIGFVRLFSKTNCLRQHQIQNQLFSSTSNSNSTVFVNTKHQNQEFQRIFNPANSRSGDNDSAIKRTCNPANLQSGESAIWRIRNSSNLLSGESAIQRICNAARF